MSVSLGRPDRASSSERRFWWLLLGVIAIGAVVRLAAILADHRVLVGGDGFTYHIDAYRIADGFGYTNRGDQPMAYHPPGWVTVLGAMTWLGARSVRAHQFVGAALGLGVIALVGLVGRRFVNARVGLLAAAIAALYPGFWVLERQLLSEPLALVLLGLLLLSIARLRDRPTLAGSVAAGALCGLLALVRPELLVLLGLVVAPLLLRGRALPVPRRVWCVAAAVVAAVAVTAPWSIYISSRLERPVILSTGGGNTFLSGNCAPHTFSGERVGFYDIRCNYALAAQHRGLDRSEMDPLARRAGVDNVRDNLGKLPGVVLARFGRLLGLFRPSQTVGFVADWQNTGTGVVWAWVASFWVLLPLAVFGGVRARRSGVYVWPLVAPAAVVIVLAAATYGEPRYHSAADLGIIVLAAVGVDALLASRRRAEAPAAPAAQTTPVGEPAPTRPTVGS